MTTDDTFDRWAEVYEAMIDWPKRLSREGPFYRRVLEQIGAKSVLDAACGTGQHAAMLHGWGLEVEGADLSPSMIERARATFGQSDRLRFVVRGFAEKVERPASFDAVLCVGNSLALARIPRTSGGENVSETAEIRRRERQTSVPCALAADAAAVAGAVREMLAAVRPGGVVILHLLNLWRLADGPCLWQNCRRATLSQGEVLILKGVHRCQRRGYVDLIVMNPRGGPPLATDSVAFLGLEAGELESQARQAGASAVHAYGNYQDEPYHRSASVDLVMVIEK
jgi:SAM-dependent methyltransferase